MSQIVQSLVFIDSNVTDIQHLLDGVRPGYQVHVLSPNQDGVEQITSRLQTASAAAREIHIISHGAPGSLFLGNSALTLDTLAAYADQLQSWFQPSTLTRQPSNALYLYGCNVAAGDAGAEFLAKLHDLTGAAIGASTSRVGCAELGGSWSLDVAIGTVEQPVALTNVAQQTYSGVLIDVNVNTSTPIPDGDTNGIAVTFTVSGADAQAVVSDVTLSLKIAHILRGDLDVELESPDGTVRQLIAVASADNFDNYDLLLTDDPNSSGLTTTAINDGNNDTLADPIDRDAAPVESFAAFDGETVNGDWILRIKDLDTNSIGGTFQAATLSVETQVVTNEVPVFDAVSDPVNFDENSTADVITVTVTDADKDTIQFLSLEGDDSSSFTLKDNGDGTATITPVAAFDLEGENSDDGDDVYNLLVKATDGKVASPVEQVINVAIQNANDQPTGSVPITSDGTGFQAGDTLTADTGSLSDEDGLTGATFSFDWQTSTDGLTGWTTLNAADQNTYTLTSGDVDNYLRVVVSYTDDGGFANNAFESAATQQITGIPNDPPVFDPVTPNDFVENSTGVAVTVNASDSDTPITYSLDAAVGDNDLFDVNSSSGAITFKAAPDFENPLDDGANNQYEVEVKATDALGASSTQTITITVVDGNDTPVNKGTILNTTVTTPEDTDYVFSSANGNAITVDDPDVGETLRVVLSVPQGQGTIALGDTSGITVINNNTNVVTITGATQAQVNAALEGLTYTPVGDFTGSVTFTINTADTEQLSDTDTVTFTVENVNDPASISGDLSGTIVEGSAEMDTGTVTVSETQSDKTAGDVEAITVPNTTVTGEYGTFSIVNGTWTYNYTGELPEGANKTDSFTIEASDGTTATVTINITGTNDDPIITGDTTVSGLTENNNSFATGNLTISDGDGPSEEAFEVISDQSGTYGFFSISSTGTWTYILDNSREVTDALASTETVQDTFTIETADGTTQDFIVNIQGTNDLPQITGSFSGSVQEETTLSATGSLTVDDVDNGESFFTPIVSKDAEAIGTYGTFTIDANGNWNYTLDNAAAANPLSAGEQDVDTFTVTTIDGTTRSVTITVEGSNDGAAITIGLGDSNAETITEDDTAPVTGTLSIADADDGEAEFQPILPAEPAIGNYGTFTIDANGNWSYTLTQPVDTLPLGQSKIDSFEVTSKDGSATETVTITIDGVNDAATISSAGAGETKTGEVTEDIALTASGTLSVSDVDTGEAGFQVVTGGTTANQYGTFDIDAAGNWTYTLDNDLPAVQDLDAKGTLTDSFDVTSKDSSASETVTITIRGSNDNPAVAGAVTATYSEDDAGTLTVNLLQGATDNDSMGLSVANLSPSTAVDGIQVVGDTLEVTPSAYNSLQEGATEVITYTYDIIDGAGGSVSQTATITINGINDAPVITPEDIKNSDLVESATEEDAAFTIDLTRIATDPDEGDVLEATFINPDKGDTSGVTINGSTLAVDPSAYESLAEGATEVIEYTYRITDGTAIVADLTASITITGVNDAPTIGGDTSGSVTESNDGAVTDLTTSGNLTITDIDTGEDAFINETLTGKYGSLTIDTKGAWNYTVANDATIDALGADDTLTDTFTVKSADNTTQDVVITINGADDVGTLADPAQLSAEIAEDTFANTLIVSKQLTLNDPDAGEGTFKAETLQGQYGSLTIDSTGKWEYNASNTQTAVQELSGPLGMDPAEELVDTFQVESDDGNTFDIDVTITGVNDAPTLGGETTGAVTEDTDVTVVNKIDSLVATGALTVQDPDSDESAFDPSSVANVSGPGSLTIDANGNWEYTVDNSLQAIQDLAANETLMAEFTVASVDGTQETITLTINGTSGPATISGDVTGSVTEDLNVTGGVLEVTGVLNVDDEDIGQSDFTPTVTPSADAKGTLTIGMADKNGDATWTYQVNNSDVQSLDVDDDPTYTETFTVSTIDGTEETITITINGAEDTPTFGGDLTGDVTEDSVDANDDLVATGTLTVNDADADESLFSVDPGTGVAEYQGTYGTLTIDANGAWTYKADNTQTAIQELDAGATPLVDSFDAIATVDGTTLATADVPTSLDITIKGVDDDATIRSDGAGETKTGTIGEDDTAAVTGKMTVLDDDAGEALFQVVTDQPGDNLNGYGTFSIDAQGNWSYTLDNDEATDPVQSLPEGETATDTYTFKSADGSVTETVEVTITGANDSATISSAGPGETKAGSVAEDGTLQATGQLSVKDVDMGEAEFEPIANDEGTYGTFSIFAEGGWTYDLDNSKVQGLTSADTPTETFTVTSEDGTATETVIITITGADDTPIFEGDSTGEVTEDRNLTTVGNVDYLTTSGTLNAIDADANQSGFEAITTPSQGAIGGELTIDAQGNWDYKVDTSLQAIQELSENSPSLTEEFTVKSLDGTTTKITITINGSDDEAQIVGNPDQSAFSGLVVEDDKASATATGDLDVIDVDSADQDFNADQQSGLYGTFSIDTDGVWTYELDNTATATNRLTENDIKTEKFTVSIPDGTQETVSITVVGANDAPDGLLTGSLNISGTEDIAIANIPRTTFTSGITDPEGDPLVIQQDGGTPFINPAQGTLTDNGNGTFTFQPASDFNGEVTVNYVISDGITTSAPITKTFMVAPANDAPTTTNGPTGNLPDIDEDTQNVFAVSDLTAGFTDVDGDELSISNLRANGSTANIVNNNGVITYTPPANFSGPVVVTYSVVDGKGGSVPNQSLSFNVNEVNDIPAGQPEGVIADTLEDTAFDIPLTTLLAGFNDVDNDTLRITSIFVDVGTISPVGDGSGPFTYTPPENVSGPVEVTYSISDGRGGTVSNQKLTFNITPDNDIPVFVGPEGGVADGLEDEPLIIQASTLLQGFEDADNDMLSVQSLVPSVGTEANIVDNGDGTFTYTPPENENGEVTLTYTVTDNAGGNVTGVTRTFNLASVNDAPEGTSEFVIEPLDENTPLTILKSDLLQGFTDPDQPDGSGLSIAGLPTVSAGTGIIQETQDGLGYVFTPTTDYNGAVTLSYNVTDGQEDVAGAIDFQVQPINNPPGGSVVILNEVKQGVELAIETSGLTDSDGLTQVVFDRYQWQIAPANFTDESDWQDIAGATSATYTPTNDDVGSVLRVVIDYTDDGGFPNTVISTPTGAIANANDQPTGQPTGTIPDGTEDTEQIIASAALLEGFSDPDGNGTLSVSEIAVPVEQGTIVPEGGNFKFTPADNYSGDVTITYTVTDGEFTITNNTRTLALAPVNDLPTVSGPIDIDTNEDDAPFSVDLVQNATDIESPTLTTDLILAEPITGITLEGSTLQVDPGAYDALARDGSETLTFKYNVVDDDGGTAPQTVTIRIAGANDAPEGNAIAELSPSLQDTQRLLSPNDLLEGFADPDGDDLSIETITADTGTVTAGENGNFVYQPEAGYVGPVNLTYSVTDGAASISGTQSFELKSNQVPSNVFNFFQYVQFNEIDEGRAYTGVTPLNVEIGQVSLAAMFDETYYLSQYSDIATAVNRGAWQNGFDHFVTFGLAEGRNPSLYYNEAFYLENNRDVAAAVEAGIHSSGLSHYLNFGHYENRVASSFFEPNDYVLSNPDVEAAIINGGSASGFEHFVEFGASEGRAEGLLFVEQYYLTQNPDVAEAVQNGVFGSGYEHYIRFGQKELSRNPGPLFNEADYLGSNSDVADGVEAGGNSSGFEHFFRYGRAEGRPQFTPETFNNLG